MSECPKAPDYIRKIWQKRGRANLNARFERCNEDCPIISPEERERQLRNKIREVKDKNKNREQRIREANRKRWAKRGRENLRMRFTTQKISGN